MVLFFATAGAADGSASASASAGDRSAVMRGPGERLLPLSPFLVDALRVADDHWTARNVPPAAGPAVLVAARDITPEAGEPYAAEAAELPGRRIWLAQWFLADTLDYGLYGPRRDRWGRIWAMTELCAYIVHGRGHNRGLHDGHDAVMGAAPGSDILGWAEPRAPFACRLIAREHVDRSSGIAARSNPKRRTAGARPNTKAQANVKSPSDASRTL